MLFDGLIDLEFIKSHEDLKETVEWSQYPEERKQEEESKYQEKSRNAKAMLQLSNMVIKLVAKVTKECPEPFTSEELAQKFAEAIDFSLDQLAPQKGLKVKIKDPKRF